MLRIITLNLNGIRSAERKGCFAWLGAQKADVVCVQEVKAQERDLDPAVHSLPGYRGFWSLAEKPGYAGVGLLTGDAVGDVSRGFGNREFDAEGRWVSVDWSSSLSVASLYLPSGSSSEERQAAKFRFMEAFFAHLKALRQSGRELVICGDWNIAHRAIDLKNWKGNQKNSGFLPEERAWLSRVFDDLGYVDVYRRLYPEATSEAYTWWSNRGQAWSKNVGWRIDYQIATPGIAATARRASVYKDQRFSDHAPLVVDYDG